MIATGGARGGGGKSLYIATCDVERTTKNWSKKISTFSLCIFSILASLKRFVSFVSLESFSIYAWQKMFVLQWQTGVVRDMLTNFT